MTEPEFKLERLTVPALPEFERMMRAFFEEIGMAPDWINLDRDVTIPLVAYEPPKGEIWLGHRPSNGEVVGVAAIRTLAKHTGELKRLYVSPEHRRQGVGTALLQQSLGFAKKQGFWEVLLTLRTNQKAALAFFNKHQFSPCARYQDEVLKGVYLFYRFPA